MDKNLKKTDKLLDIISLSDFKSRPFIFLFILIFLFLIPIDFLEKGVPNISICKKVLGENCPSSGITRGLSSLLKGDVDKAIDYNILSIPVFIVILSLISIDIYKIKKSRSHKAFRN